MTLTLAALGFLNLGIKEASGNQGLKVRVIIMTIPYN